MKNVLIIKHKSHLAYNSDKFSSSTIPLLTCLNGISYADTSQPANTTSTSGIFLVNSLSANKPSSKSRRGVTGLA